MSEALLSHAVAAVKRARRTAGRVRRRVEQINTVPALSARARPLPALRPAHLSVLSGRTLNVAVAWPRAAAGVTAARLVLERRGRQQSVPLEQEPQPDGTLLLTATAPLRHTRYDDAGLSGPRLDGGLWRMTVAVTDARGRTTRCGIASPDAPAGDGPTLPSPPSTTSGATFRPVRSVDGHAMLKVTGPREHAELLGFDLHWDRVTVHGRLLAAAGPAAEYTAEAVRRGSATAVPATPVWDGDRFTFDVPLAAMARGARAQRMWDVQLRRGRTRLKLARRLTDVRRPKKVFRTPFRTIATEDGTLLRVHAHLSAAGTFAVSCAPFTTSEETA
ncbi:hypothetical protein ADL22_17275 [Streptomyces sp. NRRL F-4489]|uniref:hypothetical protein n=1 Tax=Streptomyces sp. NRRL F-4489 TaxID=1609095 RepID=UPI00074B071F|nr:hypothetical protein [Streptomyces sp. NRRL F-4489]KUL38778.1 hypothetical protein ADL22_17275 [Streptomyces sp. NRRL F-4489]